MTKKNNRRRNTIFIKMLAPLLIVMLIQSFLVFGMYQTIGISDELESGAFSLMSEKTLYNAANFEKDMLGYWADADDLKDIINWHFSNVLSSSGKKANSLKSDADLQNALLSAASGDLVHLIERNRVTGAFIILEGETGSVDKPIVYFRAKETSKGVLDYTSIELKNAPMQIAEDLGVTKTVLLKPTISISENSKFYIKPVEAALVTERSGKELGYWTWSDEHCSRELGMEDGGLIYIQPLSHMGVVYGAAGVTIGKSVVENKLCITGLCDLPESGSGLLFRDSGILADNNSYECKAMLGDSVKNRFFSGQALALTPYPEKQDTFSVDNGAEDRVDLAVKRDLNLYPDNSPFKGEIWSVIGVRSQDALTGYAYQAGVMMKLILLSSLIIGIVGIIIVANMITKPIELLAGQLRQKDPNGRIALDKLGIAEIDELSEAIEALSLKVAGANRKLTDILGRADASIAVFEYHNRKNNQIIYTDQFAQLFDMPKSGNNVLKLRQFLSYVRKSIYKKESVSDDGRERIYNVLFRGRNFWIRYQSIDAPTYMTGIVTDVTRELEERRRLEHDRDYDILTDVYNRRAFHKILKSRFDNPSDLMTAAIIMLDLDNLKSVNNAYGHDYGDKYIRLTADTLRVFSSDKVVVARLAGDEFIVFLHNYSGKSQIRELCETIKSAMKNASLGLPDGTDVSIQISAGIAWYPDDSQDCEELMRFADFAMYMVKRTNKGQFKEFDYGFYNKHSYLLYSKNELDQIIDNTLIDYQFQPIVDTVNGDIFAYEALMRPRGETIQDPSSLISLARAHSRLHQIEKITFYRAMEEFSKLRAAEETSSYLFVNSISNQFFSEEDLADFTERYSKFLSRIVVEITEEDKGDDILMTKKLEFMRINNQKLALDDFGVGYSNESIMLDYSPDYIKIDMSIIRNIHRDEKRQSVTNKLIAYGKNAGIKMLAEGVEKKEEMDYLINAGIDFIQGYYVCRPMCEPPLELTDIKLEIAELRRGGEDSLHNSS